MFTIRSHHIDAFLPQGKDFIPWAKEHLKENHAEAIKDLSDEVLEKRIQVGVCRADRYGIHEGAAGLAFIGMMFEFAPNFDEHPAIQPLLKDTSLPPLARMDKMSQEVPPEQWEEVKKNYDKRAWNG